MPGELDGAVTVVTAAQTGIGRGLALAVSGAGACVALLGDPEALAPAVAEIEARDGRAVAIDVSFGTRDDVRQAFDEAADELGGPVTGVVHTWMPPEAFERGPLEQVDDDRWNAVWEGAMQAALFVLQAGYAPMRAAGHGRFVFVTPTIALSGAEQLVPYTAAVEGQRVLAKSAARQWGPDGITVNCVAPAPELVPVGVDSMVVSLAPPALGRAGDAETDLGAVVVSLLGERGAFLTGLTLCADGGVWMAP